MHKLRYADDTTLMAESKEELKNLLMKSDRGELKSWLKTQHSKNDVRQKRDTDIKNRLLDSVGEGESGMICENNIETCILSYVK